MGGYINQIKPTTECSKNKYIHICYKLFIKRYIVMIKTHVKICHNITKLYCFVLKTITIFNDLCQKIH